MISYQMDVYRGKAEAAGSFWIFGSYICMFPQLTSGPIMRYGDAQDSLEAVSYTHLVRLSPQILTFVLLSAGFSSS